MISANPHRRAVLATDFQEIAECVFQQFALRPELLLGQASQFVMTKIARIDAHFFNDFGALKRNRGIEMNVGNEGADAVDSVVNCLQCLDILHRRHGNAHDFATSFVDNVNYLCHCLFNVISWSVAHSLDNDFIIAAYLNAANLHLVGNIAVVIG